MKLHIPLQHVVSTGFVFLFSLSSCNYLDFDETSGLNTKENMYKYYANAQMMLTDVYLKVPQDFGIIGGAMRDCGTDDAEFADQSAEIQSFNNGKWSPVNTLDEGWFFLEGIRSANDFIDSMKDTDYSKYSTLPDYKGWMEQIKLHPYEARVLRAYFFLELAKRYGDVPMPLSKLTTQEANSIGKTAFDDVIKFIVRECDESMEVLPLTHSGLRNNEVGRVTKGVAMAIKARALLYAASPLHNPSDKKDVWEKAAKASLDIINLDLYRLDKSSPLNNPTSPEIIFYRMNGASNTFELRNFPIRFTEGSRSTPNTATFPTQNLVNAFETKNGYPVRLTDAGFVSDDPSFDSAHPYGNRDPRLERTVLYDGASFKGTHIDVAPGGADAPGFNEGGTRTGYYLRKYLVEKTSFSPSAPVSDKHTYVIYRYAETLLSYAEAMVNAFGDPEYTDETFTRSALWAINQVRSNAGMPAIPSGLSKKEFMEKVQNERRVELAFEDHRFWDIRRWKIGGETQREIFGVSVNKTASGQRIYTLLPVEKRVWDDRMYLYPYPLSEELNNPNLSLNNQGW
ncbi:MAG: RagB/SusD family nutrient uptake outer membrane protein [Porphyromonas sp.]|nr:RagB/SusD family nutrient uptake outer membrane protein [Bacteroidales bacterium]MDY3100693.1 RagB/SusD family nutrient uptake outer membrane protein [Porphyromonas sp.]